jgi:putative hydrolase of the HAD superfamily
MPSRRAILFDLDNTLADRRTAFGRYAVDFFQRWGTRLSHQDRVAGPDWIIAIDDDGRLPRNRFCEQLAARYPEVGLDADAVWRDHSQRLWTFYEPLPEVTSLVDRLARDFRLAVVTNGSALNQRRKLQRIGLVEYFEHVVISGEAGFEKPDRRIFGLALKMIQVCPEETLFVGDDPMRDILGASQAGLTTCWIRGNQVFPEGLPQPDIVVDHLTELESRLGCSMPAR